MPSMYWNWLCLVWKWEKMYPSLHSLRPFWLQEEPGKVTFSVLQGLTKNKYLWPPSPSLSFAFISNFEFPPVRMLKGYSSFQDLCPVASEKGAPPKTAGGGESKEKTSNRTTQGLQVRPCFHIDNGKIPLWMAITSPATLGSFKKFPILLSTQTPFFTFGF